MNTRNVPDEIKAQLSIDSVVGGYLPLKRAGRIYKTLCPFHGEKTPSFTVSPDRGIFKCFGCGEGGDIFDFVMKMEGLTFPEAVRLLGEKAGVPMEEWNAAQKPKNPNEPSKTQLFALNEYVAKFWHAVLTKHPKAEGARSYLKQRGLSEESIESFQIGYAPFGRATSDALSKGSFSGREVQAAGAPDKMQDRIVFPITDLTGRVIGFTGRLLELPEDPRSSSSRGPKYWNTPETPLFIKSRAVFALHQAKHAIQERQLALLAEGQMDVIMLHQHGYPNTVASSGTALTAEQLKLIHRFAPAIAFAYDQDKAGIEATKRGLVLALEEELIPWVVVIPRGSDPAECLQKDPKIWEEAYTKRLPYMDWIIAEALREVPRPLTSDRKKQLARELLDWVARIRDETEQADWFRRLSASLETSEDNLRALFSRLHPKIQVSSSRETTTPTPRDTSSVSSKQMIETVVSILTTVPQAFAAISQQVSSLTLVPTESPVSKYIDALLEHKDPDKAEAALTDEERKELALLAEERLTSYDGVDLSPAWAASELTILLQRVRSAEREQGKARIADAIRVAQELGDQAKVKELFAELQKLL